MKFEFDWPKGFRGMFENVDGRLTDRQQTYWYTISSPMSLWLRCANYFTGTFPHNVMY